MGGTVSTLLAFLVAAAATPSPSPPARHSGTLTDVGRLAEIAPPERYRGDTFAIVLFGNQETVTKLCGAADEQDYVKVACANGAPRIMVAPNPCQIAEVDLYAAILCHELGHLNGWAATHGD